MFGVRHWPNGGSRKTRERLRQVLDAVGRPVVDRASRRVRAVAAHRKAHHRCLGTRDAGTVPVLRREEASGMFL